MKPDIGWDRMSSVEEAELEAAGEPGLDPEDHV